MGSPKLPFSPLTVQFWSKRQRKSCIGNTERREDDGLADVEHGSEDTSSELGEIVLIAMPDLLDQSMGTQALEQVGGTRGGELGEMASEVSRAKAADTPFSTRHREEEAVIVVEKEIESTVGATAISCRLADFVDCPPSGVGVVNGCDEGEISLVGRCHELAQVAKAVDVLA